MKYKILVLAAVSAVIVVSIFELGSQRSSVLGDGESKEIREDNRGHAVDHHTTITPKRTPNLDSGLLEIKIAGKPISVNTYFVDINEYQLPADKSAGYLYDALSKKANSGDPVAARLLSGLLNRCGETFTSSKEHAAAIKSLKEEGRYPSANPDFSGINVTKNMITQVADHFEREYQTCKDLPVERRSEVAEWAKIAADQGDFLSIKQLISLPGVSGQDKVRLMERQWNEFGLVEGTTGLAAVLSGLSNFTDYKDVEIDPTRAYAYFLISSKINIAVMEKTYPTEALEMEVELSTFGDLLASKLGPQEHLEAEEMAISLIENNPHCCAFDPRQSYTLSEQR